MFNTEILRVLTLPLWCWALSLSWARPLHRPLLTRPLFRIFGGRGVCTLLSGQNLFVQQKIQVFVSLHVFIYVCVYIYIYIYIYIFI